MVEHDGHEGIIKSEGASGFTIDAGYGDAAPVA
jgi:hypothetical protein